MEWSNYNCIKLVFNSIRHYKLLLKFICYISNTPNRNGGQRSELFSHIKKLDLTALKFSLTSDFLVEQLSGSFYENMPGIIIIERVAELT